MSTVASLDVPRATLWDRAPLWTTIAVAYVAVMAASFANLADPMVRHDDFPALMADPSGFYIKTLHEGRWLNYWWHLRGIVTPAWLNFALYQLCWAVFAGAAAVNALGRDAPRWYVIGLALMILVAPPALLISLWFNTLIPGLALVAVFAVLACYLKPDHQMLLLPVFVPLTLMAYTTYPLLLLAICLTTAGARRTPGDLIGLVVLFVGSFAFGIALIYGLNLLEHGVFGIPMADWRNPSPAHDLTSLIQNLGLVWSFLAEAASALSFEFTPAAIVHGLLFCGATLVLLRLDPWAAVYIVTGLLAGLGLLTLQIVTTGVTVPVRALGFAWVLYAILLVRVAVLIHGQHGLAARMARNMIVLITASYLLQTGKQYMAFTNWQSLTRDMATLSGPGDAPIYVTGRYAALPEAEAAGIQQPRGLRLRLTHLTGRPVIICDETPVGCDPLPAALRQPGTPGPHVLREEGFTVIQLPQ